jgi:hypothetical protein
VTCKLIAVTSTLSRRLLRSVLLLAIVSMLVGSCCSLALARPVNLTPPKKKPKPTAAPSCTVFANQVAGLDLGTLKGPNVTNLGAHHSICSWTGQQSGRYVFQVLVQVSPSSAVVGRRLMDGAKEAALAAEQKPGGAGEILKGNPRHGTYFEQLAYWSEEQPNTETRQCPTEFNGGVEGKLETAIEPEQSSPQCLGQPGLEGNFVLGYGSPKPNVEPMILEISVASQIDEGGPLGPARIVRAAFAGHY